MIKIDSAEFMSAYRDSYAYISENESRFTQRERARYNKAIAEFDDKIQTNPKFRADVRTFESARHYKLSTDIDVAAFMYAKKGLPKPRK